MYIHLKVVDWTVCPAWCQASGAQSANRGPSLMRKRLPPQENTHPPRTLGIGLRRGPRQGGVLMSEVPLWRRLWHGDEARAFSTRACPPPAPAPLQGYLAYALQFWKFYLSHQPLFSRFPPILRTCTRLLLVQALEFKKAPPTFSRIPASYQ